jgi:hypothetical protein
MGVPDNMAHVYRMDAAQCRDLIKRLIVLGLA